MTDTFDAGTAGQMGLGFAVAAGPPPSTLTDRFVVPPFSVLDRRQGYWRRRVDGWKAIGIRGEEGRAATTFNMAAWAAEKGKGGADSDTSIFDPVLCELAYRWLCPPDGLVFDPFAGGSVRGIVAAALGRRYYGLELSDEQVVANRQQAAAVFGPSARYDFGAVCPPTWQVADATNIATTYEGPPVDLIFTCPPYYDLEVYSDDQRRDLSAMSWPRFVAAYRHIAAQAVEQLRDDRFAAVVVGDVRDKRTGGYRGLVHETIVAFEEAGAKFYNAAVVIDPGSAALRAAKQFTTSRKLVTTHQHLLIFVKGDERAATAAVGDDGVMSTDTPMEQAA